MNESNKSLSLSISNFLFMLTDEVVRGLNEYLYPNYSTSVEVI